MPQKLKHIVAFAMAMLMLWSAMPIFSLPVCAEDVAQASVSEDDLRAAVEPQIRAFAKSINQSNADDSAAKALAKHGLSGGGKKLSVGKSHALTATIWNSEMFQDALVESCIGAVRTMQQLDLESLPYSTGCIVWIDNDFHYYLHTKTSTIRGSEYRDWMLGKNMAYSGKKNAYDNSLTWMAGSTDVRLQMERTKITTNEVTYRVTVTSSDCFDFHTSSNSGFKNLISGLAALLFKEFDWEASVSFDLKTPYSCTHSSGAYHWNYDAKNHSMSSDATGVYTENKAISHSYENSQGDPLYYFELAQPIRLYHDKPWVIEYDTRNPLQISLNPFENTGACTQPGLILNSKKDIFFESQGYVKIPNGSAQVRHYYGLQLRDLYEYNKTTLYTFRLENKVLSAGKNMIYLTVIQTETGEILINAIPLDDYYYAGAGEKEATLQNTADEWLVGKDLHINYIGNRIYWFGADYFDLRIWENGIDGADGTYCTSKVTKPTCTKGGYTTYTCSLCGYSFTGDKTSAKGHTYKTKVTAPTCTEKGYTTHTCSCGESYVDSYVNALGHVYVDHVCTVCGAAEPYTYGDLDGNGVIVTSDVVLLRRYIAGGYGVTINPLAADLNGDGVLTSTDVVILRRYIAGGYGIELPNKAA